MFELVTEMIAFSCYILLLAFGISHASISSKCPELMSVPSDSSSALLLGMVQDVTAPDKNGEYGVVLLLQHIIRGQDVMEDILSSKDDPQR